MLRGKILIVILIISAFFVGCAKSEDKKPIVPPIKEEATDEQTYLSFKESVFNGNHSFLLEKVYTGSVNYSTTTYFDGINVYGITTSTVKTHKLYTENFVYTNYATNAVNATKSISTLKWEIIKDLFTVNWSFDSKIVGESPLFDKCYMQISQDKTYISFVFEDYEGTLLVSKVNCKLILMKNLEIKQIIIPQLKEVL